MSIDLIQNFLVYKDCNKYGSYLIYGLVDPRDLQIKYIGKSIQGLKRAFEHKKDSSLKNDGNTKKANWIRSLKKQDLLYKVVVLEEIKLSATKEFINSYLYSLEQFWINFYKSQGIELKNGTDGGPGAINRVTSEATRQKMSDSAKKRELPTSLLENQKIQYERKDGLKYCSKCETYKEISLVCKNKICCKECLSKTRPSRVIPGAREIFIATQKIAIIAYKDNQIIDFSGLREAAQLIGGRCNKTGIRNAIKNNKQYYGYYWSLKCL